jgi:hypothetical protein
MQGLLLPVTGRVINKRRAAQTKIERKLLFLLIKRRNEWCVRFRVWVNVNCDFFSSFSVLQNVEEIRYHAAETRPGTGTGTETAEVGTGIGIGTGTQTDF